MRQKQPDSHKTKKKKQSIPQSNFLFPKAGFFLTHSKRQAVKETYSSILEFACLPNSEKAPLFVEYLPHRWSERGSQQGSYISSTAPLSYRVRVRETWLNSRIACLLTRSDWCSLSVLAPVSSSKVARVLKYQFNSKLFPPTVARQLWYSRLSTTQWIPRTRVRIYPKQGSYILVFLHYLLMFFVGDKGLFGHWVFSFLVAHWDEKAILKSIASKRTQNQQYTTKHTTGEKRNIRCFDLHLCFEAPSVPSYVHHFLLQM